MCNIKAYFYYNGAVLDGEKDTSKKDRTTNAAEYFLPSLVVLSFLDVLFFHQELPQYEIGDSMDSSNVNVDKLLLLQMSSFDEPPPSPEAIRDYVICGCS